MQRALEAQKTFLDTKAALSAALKAAQPSMQQVVDDHPSGSDSLLKSSTVGSRVAAPAEVPAASRAPSEQPAKEGTAMMHLRADAHTSCAPLLAAHASPGVSHISADSADSPGSVENDPHHANRRRDRIPAQGAIKGLFSSLSFNKRTSSSGIRTGVARSAVGALRSRSESGAVLGERHTNSDMGSRRSTDALSLLDSAWFSHSGNFD